MRGLLAAASLAACIAGIGYLALALGRTIAFRKRRPRRGCHFSPPLTVLKPLCGLEPALYENLCSFCDQDYPEFQIIFGVREAGDPAIEVAKRVIQRFPNRDVSLTVDGRVRGANLKVSNVLNMMESAKHDVLVVADSDARVGPTYLHSVVEPFADERVGAVTCLYRGVPGNGLASKLGAMFINDQFIPSVLVAIGLSPMDFCLGATMAVTRRALEAVGGFEKLDSRLGDDQLLGKLVRMSGFSVELSSYVVENRVNEPDLKSLWVHERRWARTIAAARPLGYAFSFISYGVPVSLTYLALARNMTSVLLFAIAAALRVALHYSARWTLQIRSDDSPWLIPLRDAFGLAIWAGSFFGRRVLWRDRKFDVDSAGQMRALSS